MIAELTDGRRIDCEDQPMGGGVAGTAYFSRDRKHVVKIFKTPHPDTRRMLEEVLTKYNCVTDEPYWKQLMSWPEALVVKPGLGVCMPCAPQGMHKMCWIIFPKLYNQLPRAKKNWDKRLLIATRLATAVARMHRCGVAHSDLSPNNIMVDPLTGALNLIDLDGLVVPGFLPPQVLGTPDYMAPEVISGRAMPSISTDRHALAVIIYQLLLFRHPFRGPKVFSLDVDEDERMALGECGVFIDHPYDMTNRPLSRFWPTALLGSKMKELFERVFVHGLADPTCRPTASEWQSALIRLFDRAVGCGNRNCEELYFPVTEGRSISCPWCGTPFAVRDGVPVLRLYVGDKRGNFHLDDDYWIAGYPDKTLHSWHVESGLEPGPNVDSSPLGQIVLEKGRWFLRNLALPHARIIENGTLGRHFQVDERIELTEGLALMLESLPKGRMAYVQWIK